MAKEILLYSPIFGFTAENFITQLEAFKDEDIVNRINSPGGSVFASWGMVAKSKEHKGSFKIKVDGSADSMAAIFLLFHKDVEALDVSKFTLHRASTFSSDPKDMKKLASINKDIRAAFESKLDIPKFEEIAGITLDEFFNSENVIDVHLDAAEAKAIGLVKKVNKLEAAEFEALSMKFAALSNDVPEAVVEKEVKKEKPKPIKMKNKEEFKAAHPEIYAQVVELGVTQERERVKGHLVFVETDAKAVKEKIIKGEEMTSEFMAEMTQKTVNAKVAAGIEGDAPDGVVVEKPGEGKIDKPGDEPTAVSKFETELKTIQEAK